jgi:hypothetical protein
MKNPWSSRWSFVKDYIPNDTSVVDFGCGNREALDYIDPTDYLGVDICPEADLVVDLNQPLQLNKKFDTALLLGVLEYLDDPEFTLNNIVGAADYFVVLSLPVKQKPEWQRAFTDASINELLCKFFPIVEHHKHGRYILSVCKK